MRRLTYGLGLLAVLLLTGCPGKKPAPGPSALRPEPAEAQQAEARADLGPAGRGEDVADPVQKGPVPSRCRGGQQPRQAVLKQPRSPR
jgi:hypothetical protein